SRLFGDASHSAHGNAVPQEHGLTTAMSRKATKDNPTRPNTTPQALTTAWAMPNRPSRDSVPRPEEWRITPILPAADQPPRRTPGMLDCRRRGSSSPNEAGHSFGDGQRRRAPPEASLGG